MIMKMEEKKYTLLSHGTLILKANALYPSFENKEKINDFYSALAGNIYDFAVEKSKEHMEKFENTERRARRDFSYISIRFFSSVFFANEKIISVDSDFIFCEGKNLVFYKKLCQVWDAEREILLPIGSFLPFFKGRDFKKDEFLFDGKDIIRVKNIFSSVKDSEHKSSSDISDYVEFIKYNINRKVLSRKGCAEENNI